VAAATHQLLCSFSVSMASQPSQLHQAGVACFIEGQRMALVSQLVASRGAGGVRLGGIGGISAGAAVWQCNDVSAEAFGIEE